MLHYCVHGTDGPWVLIAHGLFGSARNWGVMAKRLSGSFRVITPDMRNHGKSPAFPSHGYPDMAEDLAELVEHVAGRAHVIGHSMGGKAAMMLALSRPDLVDRLIVADIAPVAYDHTQLHNISAMRAVDLSAVTRRSDAEAQLAAQGLPVEVQKFLTQSLDIRAGAWMLNLDALADNMDNILNFPKVDGQFDGSALFLSGANSDYVTRAHRPAIKALFPRAQFAKVPQAGHWLHADNPRAVEATFRAFLADAAGGA